MPLYEYQCQECGARLERIQKFSDPPLQECPACGGPLTKLLSSPAIQFKGSGWYITDYARAGTKDGKEGSDTKDVKGATGTTEGKGTTETKGTTSEGTTSASDKSGSQPATPAPAKADKA